LYRQTPEKRDSFTRRPDRIPDRSGDLARRDQRRHQMRHTPQDLGQRHRGIKHRRAALSVGEGNDQGGQR
jgi:hypothetical protein